MFSVVSGSISGGSGVGEEKRLDAMNAVCVYVSTAQLVLQSESTESNGLGEQRMLDLSRLFGQLRQLLSCAVCARLLNDPYAPLNNARCHHNVCRLCVRGRKALRPLCISCKDLQDFKTYTENKTMRCLLLCYKSLCEHLLSTNFYLQLSRQKAHQALTCSGENVFGVAPMPHMTTCGDIIQEGARYEDILNAFNADLPQMAPVLKLQQPLVTMPTIATAVTNQSIPFSVSANTPLAPLPVPQKRIYTQTVPRLVTTSNPPATVSSSSSATLLPTHNTIIKLEPTNTNLKSTYSNSHLVKVNSSLSQQQHAHNQSHMVYVKNFKPVVNEPTNVHVSQLCATQNVVGSTSNGVASLSAASTITYVGPNTTGIVLPIVSSSGTTTAPLTIASAKLQSLKRQLAPAQARGGAPISIASAVKAAGLAQSETHAPLTFKVSAAPTLATSATISAASVATIATSAALSSANSTTTTATITSQQIRNPPSIKTVSNGSAMYSVLYTGVGNKITIKRKTDGDEESGQRKSVATSISTVSTPITASATTSSSLVGTIQQQTVTNKLNVKRRGCRCGNATPTPGKLTCCGQRCPCYVDSKSCIGCKCRGCRNPHRPDGGKVRPVIPELACYEIQMADENPSMSPSDLHVGNTLTTRTHTVSAATSTPPLQLSTHQQSSAIASEQHASLSTTLPSSSVATVTSQLHLTPSSSSPSSKGATLIPFISLHPISSHQTQQHQQHQQQASNITNISSNQQQTNMLPMESVLIQNADGKYQVVNVLTTGHTPHHQQNNSNIQRIHSIPQLTVASSATSSSSNSNNSHTILGNMTTVNILSNNTTSTAVSTPTMVTTKVAPQSVLLHQQHHVVNRLQQQQHQLQQKHQQQQMRLVSSSNFTTSANNTTSAVSNCNVTTSTPIQLHHHQPQHHHQQQQQHQQQHQQPHQLHHTYTQNQQLKSNIITMRTSTVNKSNNNNTQQTQTLTPILTSNASGTTITLSPIIMSSSPNTFKPELLSDSSESDFLNFTTGAVTSTTVVNSGGGGNNGNINSSMLSTIYSHGGLASALSTPRITSVPSLSSGSTGSTSGSTSRMSLGMNMNISGTTSRITPAFVEVIEASDL